MNLDPSTFPHINLGQPLNVNWVGDDHPVVIKVEPGYTNASTAQQNQAQQDQARLDQMSRMIDDVLRASGNVSPVTDSGMEPDKEERVRKTLQTMVTAAVTEALQHISVANTDKYKAAVEMMAMLFDQGHDEAAKLLCKSMVGAQR